MLKAKNVAEFEKSLPSILSVVENMPFAVIALEPKTGEPAYLNKIGEELLANSDHENFFTTLKEAYYIRYVKPYANSLAADYPITRDFNESPFDLLEPYLKKLDGSLQRLYVKMVPLVGAKGELLYSLALVAENPILLFGQDPSKKRTDFFRKVVANSKDITTIFSASGQEVFVSNACFKILGYSPSEIIEIGVFNLLHPKDRNKIYSEFQELLQRPNKMMRAEHRIRHKNGKWLHFESIAENKLFDRDIQGIVLNQRDITQRKTSEKKILKATKALAQSEKNYKGLYESLRDGLVRVDKDGTIVEANKAFVKMLGYDSVDELKVNYKDITPQKYHEFEQELIETQVMPRGYSNEYEKELIKKDGSTIPVNVKTWLIKRGETYQGGWGIIRDISEKKQAERGLLQSAVQLADSEAKYRGLFESSKDAIVKVDMDGNILEANNAYIKMLGYDSIDELKSTYQEITPKKWHAFEQNIVEMQILPRGYSDDYEKEYIRKDGSVFPISIKTWLIKKDGESVGMWAIIRDISEKKEAEENIKQATKALAESEAKYRGLYESIKDGIVKTDVDGNIVEANQAFIKMLGYSTIDELKRHFFDITPKKWHAFEENLVKNVVFARGYSDDYEKEYISKNGTIFPVNIRVYLITKHGKATGMWGLVRDITESKNAENRFKEMHDKIEHLNTREHLVREQERISLASAIHDELGQSLTAIKLELGWMLDKANGKEGMNPKIQSLLDLTQTTLEQVQQISSGLRTCAVDEMGFKGALKCFCKGFSNRARIKTKVTIKDISGINRQLEVAIYRIVQEALTNVTRHSKATMVNITIEEDENNILLEISDNGVGIDKKHLKSGKALGIVGMRERAAYFNGTVEFFNKNGTTIKVIIPLIDALRLNLSAVTPPPNRFFTLNV